ncbi:Uncharacterized protein APZ42_029123 [Daphnia magna]|uniref:Uncharacterized protein n=1 Tax=Daphnia magna TaxID=35525 RepID=A0A164PWP3_9CRUS|nr:Uncharacterized protein APZ42_029123 [Daphnia magna]
MTAFTVKVAVPIPFLKRTTTASSKFLRISITIQHYHQRKQHTHNKEICICSWQNLAQSICELDESLTPTQQ